MTAMYQIGDYVESAAVGRAPRLRGEIIGVEVINGRFVYRLRDAEGKRWERAHDVLTLVTVSTVVIPGRRAAPGPESISPVSAAQADAGVMDPGLATASRPGMTAEEGRS